MTILVVDDDPKVLQFLKKALTSAGYAVIVTDNARSAMSILVHTPINLLILDIMMPDVDGHGFCQLIRADPNIEYIPIIFLSALSSMDDMITGMVSGADEYLTKPIHLNQLLETIQEYAM